MTDRRKNPFPVDRFMGRDDEVASVVSLVNSTQSAAIIGEPRSGKTSLLRHLSGDLANVSAPDEYEAAKLFLEKLCAAFQLSPGQVIPVPGNHDLNWGLSVDAYHPVRRSKLEAPPAEGTFIAGSGDLLELRDEALYLQRFAHFATFYQAVRGEPYPLEPANQALLYALPAQHILILGLNSAWELDHHYQTRAGIHAIALSRALELVHAEPTYRDFLKIAVWHHPVQSAFEDCIKDHDFLERLAAADFRLGLHGHIHEAQNHVYRYDRSAGGRRVEIVCAGTFGAPVREWVAGYPLQYQLLRFQGESVTVETPKVDVRAAVFRDGKVLLVREQTDGLWSLPGGWADVGASPSENAVREVREETGYLVRARKMAAVYDKTKHAHPDAFWGVYKLFMLCELVGGEETTSLETTAVGFFGRHELPLLSAGRVTEAQVARMFEHHDHPDLPTDFD